MTEAPAASRPPGRPSTKLFLRNDEIILKPTTLYPIAIAEVIGGRKCKDETDGRGCDGIAWAVQRRAFSWRMPSRPITLDRNAGPKPRAFVLVLHLCTACPQAGGNRTARKHEHGAGPLAPHRSPVTRCVKLSHSSGWTGGAVEAVVAGRAGAAA